MFRFLPHHAVQPQMPCHGAEDSFPSSCFNNLQRRVARRPFIAPPCQSDVDLVFADALLMGCGAIIWSTAFHQFPATRTFVQLEVLYHVLLAAVAVERAATAGIARARVNNVGAGTGSCIFGNLVAHNLR